METNNFNEALLYLLRVIVYADGVFDEEESAAINQICLFEEISNDYYADFCERVKNFSEKDMYINGIDHVQECTPAEQLKIFSWLYKMAEVDGTIHVKEVRFLLYSIRQSDIEFDNVEKEASNLPELNKA